MIPGSKKRVTTRKEIFTRSVYPVTDVSIKHEKNTCNLSHWLFFKFRRIWYFALVHYSPAPARQTVWRHSLWSTSGIVYPTMTLIPLNNTIASLGDISIWIRCVRLKIQNIVRFSTKRRIGLTPYAHGPVHKCDVENYFLNCKNEEDEKHKQEEHGE